MNKVVLLDFKTQAGTERARIGLLSHGSLALVTACLAGELQGASAGWTPPRSRACTGHRTGPGGEGWVPGAVPPADPVAGIGLHRRRFAATPVQNPVRASPAMTPPANTSISPCATAPRSRA